jgi:hypothetical protein
MKSSRIDVHHAVSRSHGDRRGTTRRTRLNIAGVVSACVALDASRHLSNDANSDARGHIATHAPALHVAARSPANGSNVGGDATRTTDRSSTPCAAFFARAYRARCPCVARQPFGRPVLPLVKYTCESAVARGRHSGRAAKSTSTSRSRSR